MVKGLLLICCDRCERSLYDYGESSYTVGYYITKKGSAWSEYANNEDEEILCDDCLQNDMKYLKEYNYPKYVSRLVYRYKVMI